MLQDEVLKLLITELGPLQAEKENRSNPSPIDPQGIADLRKLLKSAVKPAPKISHQMTPEVNSPIILAGSVFFRGLQ
jgi:hypothetical protein